MPDTALTPDDVLLKISAMTGPFIKTSREYQMFMDLHAEMADLAYAAYAFPGNRPITMECLHSVVLCLWMNGGTPWYIIYQIMNKTLKRIADTAPKAFLETLFSRLPPIYVNHA